MRKTLVCAYCLAAGFMPSAHIELMHRGKNPVYMSSLLPWQDSLRVAADPECRADVETVTESIKIMPGRCLNVNGAAGLYDRWCAIVVELADMDDLAPALFINGNQYGARAVTQIGGALVCWGHVTEGRGHILGPR